MGGRTVRFPAVKREQAGKAISGYDTGLGGRLVSIQ
jgi:hypothetical protein